MVKKKSWLKEREAYVQRLMAGPSGAELRAVHACFPPIPGSKLLRAYCCSCNEPIRVTFDAAKKMMTANSGVKCDGCLFWSHFSKQPRAMYLTDRQACKLKG